MWDVRQQCCLGVYELPGGSVWAMQPRCVISLHEIDRWVENKKTTLFMIFAGDICWIDIFFEVCACVCVSVCVCVFVSVCVCVCVVLYGL